MDALEEWRVRGRLAAAARAMGESLRRLATDTKELGEAVAEAESLGLTDVVAAGKSDDR